ncbi:DoxX family membrane protein [Empedobacter brevis]|uniref:DoxX family membrane protein n=1 Tax=Empedobacter brevis TaxID=247 RepID=UPI0023F17DDE|nr:DoxX family membrane protein [Empedobacter brevis]
MNKFFNSKLFDFIVISARFLLCITFLSYGWGKLNGGQFGLNSDELNTPIKDLSLFKIGWYLFDHQPFKFFIGVSQILCSFLLLFDRTVIIGALFFLVIISNIIIIDETIMPETLKLAFRYRLLFYIFLCLLILYHHRNRFLPALNILKGKYQPIFKHKIWIYLLIPIGAICLELFIPCVKIIYFLITDFQGTVEALSDFSKKILSNM